MVTIAEEQEETNSHSCFLLVANSRWQLSNPFSVSAVLKNVRRIQKQTNNRITQHIRTLPSGMIQTPEQTQSHEHLQS